jgi:hypothetical protein
MKLTNRKLIDIANVPLGQKYLPTKLSFAIAANVEEASKKIKIYDAERIKLAEKFCKRDENGDPVIEDNKYVFEVVIAWDKAVQELLDTEIEVAMTTVSFDDVARCDEPGFDKLTVSELALIRFMIEQ